MDIIVVLLALAAVIGGLCLAAAFDRKCPVCAHELLDDDTYCSLCQVRWDEEELRK